jgi:hypothetical protein
MTQSPCIRPIRQKILVRKCLAYQPEIHDGKVWYREGNIVVTDLRGSFTHWAEVLDVSDDCKLFKREDIGAFVHLPEWAPQYMQKVHHAVEDGVPVDDFIVKEALFLAKNGAKPMIAR